MVTLDGDPAEATARTEVSEGEGDLRRAQGRKAQG